MKDDESEKQNLREWFWFSSGAPLIQIFDIFIKKNA